ncbi:MAG: 50S ribosomal protein L31e [Methanonatronarchaeales archaeon]|nr:50S ribosomal protein L31e [Methanonatronarchaeales archaeon]
MEERVLTVPIDVRNASREKRAPRAVKELRSYLARHLGVPEDAVYLDPAVNRHIWSRGRRWAPNRVRVRAQKFEDGAVEATLLE